MKKSIVILLDNPFFSDNPDPRVKRTSLYFLEKGFKVSVICLKNEKLPSKEVLDNIEVYRIIPSEIMRPKSIPIMRRKMAKIIYNLIDFDFIFSNDHTMLDLAVRIKKINPKKILIHDSHEFFPSYRMSFNKGESLILKIKSKTWRNIENYLEKKNSKNVDYWITVNISLAAIFNQIYKLKNRAIYIRNVPEFKKPDLDLQEFAIDIYKKLEKIKDGNNLIYIGYHVENGSGVENVFKSLKKLPDDVNFILLGSNWSVEYFNNLVKKIGIIERVLFIDPLPINYLPIVASYAKIGICPTIEDGSLSSYLSLPNKIFDYIKSNLPIIASDLPEHTNLIESYNNGRIFFENSNQKDTEISQSFLEIIENYNYFKKNALECAKLHKTENEYQKLNQIFTQ